MPPLSIRKNPMQLSRLAAFCGIHGKTHGNTKDVYLLEWLGLPEPVDALVHTLRAAQAEARRAGRGFLCLGRLPAHPAPARAAQLSALAASLLAGEAVCLPGLPEPLLSGALQAALDQALNDYRSTHPQASPSMVKNCAVRLLGALADALSALFPTGVLDADCPKCIFLGEPDGTARLFLALLPRLGCDAAAIRPTGDTPIIPGAAVVYGTPAPTFDPAAVLQSLQAPAPRQMPSRQQISTQPAVHLSPRPARTSRIPTDAAAQSDTPSPKPASAPAAQPLDYEALAGFAASVVMLEVLDETGTPRASGSGVLIAPGGIILTNFHVARGGAAYAVHVENCASVFQTDELLKYHPDFDLALLRLPDCPGRPIPLYDGPALRRGQQVVAIGSPLGLFNSVSDGIIAGFRTLDGIDMIQFTAPTSPGSSGGALLDRCGRLIGIVTAGVSGGQNLNLAVSYGIIRQFVHGFVS